MRILQTALFVLVVFSAQAGPPIGVRAGAPVSAPAPRTIAPSRGYPVQRGSNSMPVGTGRPLTGGASGINPGAYRSTGGYGSYRNRNQNYRWSAPGNWWLTPYYYPYAAGYFDTGGDDSGYYGPAAAPQYGQDPAMADLGLAQNDLSYQVQRLAQEVDHLRSGPMPATGVANPAALTSVPPAPPLTVVLRDGGQLQVQNYAVMDQTFWDFSAQPVRKIPIANIDVDASIRLTEAKGGEFPRLQSTP